MKTKSIITLAVALLASGGLTLAQTTETGRCGQPRGTCGNECDGSGYQNKGGGKGNGQGLGRGKRDGTGEGKREQKRERRRDGSGDGCKKAT